MRPKHVPIRTCVACRTSGDKRGLLRVVRDSEGIVHFDPTGKANGRGAYVCANESCISLAEKKHSLGRSLKATPEASLFEELRSHCIGSAVTSRTESEA